jgi:hypothetical protein
MSFYFITRCGLRSSLFFRRLKSFKLAFSGYFGLAVCISFISILISCSNPLGRNSSSAQNFLAVPLTDRDNSSFGFGAGTGTGTTWDGANNYLRLDHSGTPTNNSELDSTWTPEWSSLVAYWKLDNNWNDSVGSFNLTPGGSPSFSTASKLGAYAANFGGTNDYASIASAALTQTDNWTLAAWIYPTNLSVSSQIIVYVGENGPPDDGYGLALGGAGSVAVLYGGVAWNYTTSAVTANMWQHVVAVRSSGTLTVYLNGAALSPTFNGGIAPPSPVTSIGWDYGNSKFVGLIDDVAIWRAPLSAVEVQSLYSRQSAAYAGTFQSRVMDSYAVGSVWKSLSWTSTLPFLKELPDAGASESSSSYSAQSSSLTSGIVALWHLDEASGTSGNGSVLDKSGQANNGAPTSVTFGALGKLANSAQFNGSTSNICMPGTASLNLSTALTMSAWIQTSSTSHEIIIEKFGNSNEGGYGMFVDSGNQIWFTTQAGLWDDFKSNVYANLSTGWHHVAATFDGISKTIYIDGSLNISEPYVASITTNTGEICMGYNHSSNGAWFTGNIDEVAIWNRALSSTEIQMLYRRGSNRIKYQVRSCPDFLCSTNPTWLGPNGTNQTYFSELNNNAISSDGADLTSIDFVLSASASIGFSAFNSLAIPSNRYFQYRAIMESDDVSTGCNYGGSATWCSPELQSVSTSMH